MYLDGIQIGELSSKINAESSVEALTLAASYVGIDLDKLAPGLNLKDKAFTLLNELNSQTPPRGVEFLERYRLAVNAALRATVDRILTPSYYPPGDPHEAIVLGRTAFIARSELRKLLRREFAVPNALTTRVLIVRGNEPGGKSYSWQFLRHLAYAYGPQPQSLYLKDTAYTPRQFFQQVYRLLGLDENKVPSLPDNPQLAKMSFLVNAFKGELPGLARRYWLVVDELNDPGVEKPVREAAYALASAVEDVRPEKLSVFLLGYNDQYDEAQLRQIALDDAEFPSVELVAAHLKTVSENSPKPLTDDRAKEISTVLFSKYPRIDKEAMNKITREVERMSEKLSQGLQP